MTTETTRTYDQWVGRTVFDQDGQKIGKIDAIYYDTVTGQPEWLAVNTGLFGSNTTFVPFTGSSTWEDGMRVPYEKGFVKDAPNVEPDGYLTPDETRMLFDHYDLDWNGVNQSSIYGTRERVDRDYIYNRYNEEDYDRSYGTTQTTGAPTSDRREEVLEEVPIREEQVEKRELQRKARLKKYVTTEYVPVEKEEVRMEVDPDEEITKR